MFALEKPHLRKVSTLLSFESNRGSSITRTVHKNNIVKYLSNRYSVPLGTYQPHGENKVYIRIDQNELIIEKTRGDTPIAIHALSKGKGQLIKNKHHTRDRTRGINAYKDTVKESFQEESKINLFLEELSKRYPRYVRDQLQIIQKTIKCFPAFIHPALEQCIDQELWSANDFYDVAEHLHRVQIMDTDSVPSQIPDMSPPPAHFKEKARLKDLDGYLDILGGA